MQCQLFSAYYVRSATTGSQRASEVPTRERHDNPMPNCFSLVQSVPGFLTRLHDSHLRSIILTLCQQNFVFTIARPREFVRNVARVFGAKRRSVIYSSSCYCIINKLLIIRLEILSMYLILFIAFIIDKYDRQTHVKFNVIFK